MAMRIRSKAKNAVRRSNRRGGGGGGGQNAAAVTRASDIDEKSVNPRIMTLLKGVERAVHATAKRHNQLIELEKNKKKQEQQQEDGVAALSRQRSWVEKKSLQRLKKK